MTNRIKPRYRLGTQNMLDLAKDDATKIPERTLFRTNRKFCSMPEGSYVVRDCVIGVYDDHRSVAFIDIAPEGDYDYLPPQVLQPLI